MRVCDVYKSECVCSNAEETTALWIIEIQNVSEENEKYISIVCSV